MEKREANLVVARYMNGQIVRGSTQDFYPDRPLFHIQARGSSQTQAVRMRDLKAVFFVKDLAGNKERKKNRTFPAVDEGATQGRRIAVLFKDGELLVGYALTYSPEREGFFVFPHDPQGNNLRAYVLRKATLQVKLGPAAEELVRNPPKAPSRMLELPPPKAA